MPKHSVRWVPTVRRLARRSCCRQLASTARLVQDGASSNTPSVRRLARRSCCRQLASTARLVQDGASSNTLLHAACLARVTARISTPTNRSVGNTFRCPHFLASSAIVGGDRGLLPAAPSSRPPAAKRGLRAETSGAGAVAHGIDCDQSHGGPAVAG